MAGKLPVQGAGEGLNIWGERKEPVENNGMGVRKSNSCTVAWCGVPADLERFVKSKLHRALHSMLVP